MVNAFPEISRFKHELSNLDQHVLIGKHNYAIIYSPKGIPLDEKSVEQISELLSCRAYEDSSIRIMPDYHYGEECVIGTTMKVGKFVNPNHVGVDIGCGILTRLLPIIPIGINYESEKFLAEIDAVIKNQIPSGLIHHEETSSFYAEERKQIAEDLAGKFQHRFGMTDEDLVTYIKNQLGTLGGGNHFIEVGKSGYGGYYLSIHTGSRNLGYRTAKHYSKLCQPSNSFENEIEEKRRKLIRELKDQNRATDIPMELKKFNQSQGKALPVLVRETSQYDYYMADMKTCQEFAKKNRAMIADIIFKAFNIPVVESVDIDTPHNYINFDDMILRKGAIAAHKGEVVVIPMNMRDGIIVGTGKSNMAWNCSAPHGAGRVFSRAQAKKTFSMKDFRESMQGIYSTTVNKETLDECPMAYKDSDLVRDAISSTVEIIDVIRPIYNFKASQ